jgi:F-type H+-transporting ATPase subunit b
MLSVWAWAQEAPEPRKEGEHAAASAEHGASAEAEHGKREGPGDAWKWANFAILVAALGYMLGKALPPFFASRTAAIQKGIAEAQKLKAEAEERASAMERRIASLQTEIDQIRQEAKAEMAREGERLQKDAEQQIARVQAQAEQEVAAMAKAARLQLKAHSAELALALAAERLKNRVDGAAQAALIERFVRQLDANQEGARQ